MTDANLLNDAELLNAADHFRNTGGRQIGGCVSYDTTPIMKPSEDQLSAPGYRLPNRHILRLDPTG